MNDYTWNTFDNIFSTDFNCLFSLISPWEKVAPCVSMEGYEEMFPNFKSQDFNHFLLIKCKTKFICIKAMNDYTWNTFDNIFSTDFNCCFP